MHAHASSTFFHWLYLHVILTLLSTRLEAHFNLPKLHAAEHFLRSIRRFGTTDNYNTESTERLHIDLAKDAYDATNGKEYIQQMIHWLERRERVFSFETHIQWRMGGLETIVKPRRPRPPVSTAIEPTSRNVSFATLSSDHGAVSFVPALQTFIAQHRDPAQHRYTLRHTDINVEIPFSGVDVWHRVKFLVPNLQVDDEPDTLHSAHVAPAHLSANGKLLPARFDTVLINDDDADVTGMDGGFAIIVAIGRVHLSLTLGLRVGQVRVIFRLPRHFECQLVRDGIKSPGHLAYIEWFSCPGQKDKANRMFPITRSKKGLVREAAIVQIDVLCRPCQLFPRFGARADRAWTSQNVLDRCTHFFLSNWLDHHTYQTVW